MSLVVYSLKSRLESLWLILVCVASTIASAQRSKRHYGRFYFIWYVWITGNAKSAHSGRCSFMTETKKRHCWRLSGYLLKLVAI